MISSTTPFPPPQHVSVENRQDDIAFGFQVTPAPNYRLLDGNVSGLSCIQDFVS